MARIDFDDPAVTVTHTVDFDAMTPAERADKFGLDANSKARLEALTAAMAGVAHDQGTLNKLVQAGAALAVKAIEAGVQPSAILGAVLS